VFLHFLSAFAEVNCHDFFEKCRLFNKKM